MCYQPRWLLCPNWPRSSTQGSVFGWAMITSSAVLIHVARVLRLWWGVLSPLAVRASWVRRIPPPPGYPGTDGVSCVVSGPHEEVIVYVSACALVCQDLLMMDPFGTALVDGKIATEIKSQSPTVQIAIEQPRHRPSDLKSRKGAGSGTWGKGNNFSGFPSSCSWGASRPGAGRGASSLGSCTSSSAARGSPSGGGPGWSGAPASTSRKWLLSPRLVVGQAGSLAVGHLGVLSCVKGPHVAVNVVLRFVCPQRLSGCFCVCGLIFSTCGGVGWSN